ncbi:MAG: hypothetical protein KBD01_12275 [Acidobacteria bacterium]|nr:hypothetical protein [Acidobacteriota bacterium]
MSTRSAILVLALLPAGALAQDAAAPPPDENPPANAPAPAAPRPPGGLLDPRDFPVGVTVLGPPPDVEDPDDYPVGVTVLGTPPLTEGMWPRVRIEVAPGAEPAPAPPRPPVVRTGIGPQRVAPAGGAQARPEQKTIGPGISEQQKAFGRPPRPGGTPLAPISTWRPTDAYAPHEPDVPYPWNPSSFSPPVFETTWEPTSAYPWRDPARPYPWNPATFGGSLFDLSWTPTDAWGRTVGIEEPQQPGVEPAGEATGEEAVPADEEPTEVEAAPTPAVPGS